MFFNTSALARCNISSEMSTTTADDPVQDQVGYDADADVSGAEHAYFPEFHATRLFRLTVLYRLC